MRDERPVALVTGVGRSGGLGYAVCRQLAEKGHRVVLSARSLAAAQELAAGLRASGLSVDPLALDISAAPSRSAAADFIRTTYGGLDVLVNNAAALGHMGERVATADLTSAEDTLRTTLLGTWGLIQVLLPLLLESAHPRIVNVSSGAGSHEDSVFGLRSGNAMGPSYSIAKAALNALTSALATELAGTKVRVNAVCPGFTATFPGAEAMGARPVADGAKGVVWAALIADDGPSGGFFRDGKPLPW